MFEYLLRPGDEVVYRISQDTRDWRPKDHSCPPNGTKGTVVGYTVSHRFASNFGLDRYSFPEPGVYRMKGVPIVEWEVNDKKVTEPTSYFDFDVVDRNVLQERRKDLIEKNPTLTMKQIDWLIEEKVRIGDLPATEYSELDLVKFGDELGKVMSIEYHWSYDIVDNGDKPPTFVKRKDMRINEITYNISMATGGTTYLRESEMTLVQRGNVWNMLNNKPLVFVDIKEEADFARGLHKFTEVCNPANNLYSWTLPEVLAAFVDGIADGFYMSNVPFSDKRTHNVIKFDDPDLGNRVRLATLRGFGKI